MVLSNSAKSSQAAFSEGTLELESGLKINYVAPAYAAPLKENSSSENSMGSVPRKKSFIEGKIYPFDYSFLLIIPIRFIQRIFNVIEYLYFFLT